MRTEKVRLAALVLLLVAEGCSSGTPAAPDLAAGSSGDGGGASSSGAGGVTASGGNGGTIVGSTGTGGSEMGGLDASGGTGPADSGFGGGGTGDGGPSGPSPMLAILGQFTASDVPAKGPGEADPIPRSWTAPATPPDLPGEGIAQHPMLYAGEGYNTLFLVNQGKVIWTYSAGSGGEIDDVWMMTNAHVLFTVMSRVLEVTPKKEIVWRYTPPAGTEVHSCQPIGLDKVMMIQNGQPAKVLIINKSNNAVEVEHALPDAGATTHPQFRRFRMTAAGTYLAPYLEVGKVVEYDKNFNVIWSYQIVSPWAAIRLHNGNTLIQSEKLRSAREVNSKGETVWEFTQSELPAGIVQRNTQTSDRLSTGNTVIFSSMRDPSVIQAVEVTPDKKVVWVLQDWKNLGPATTAQFLDEPGIPEKPGDLQH